MYTRIVTTRSTMGKNITPDSARKICKTMTKELSTITNPPYTMCAFTWDSLTYSRNINITFVVSIPKVWETLDKLVTQGLQPWASRAFGTSAREDDRYKFHFHIMFGLRVIYKNFKVCQVKGHVYSIVWITFQTKHTYVYSANQVSVLYICAPSPWEPSLPHN